MGPVRVLCVDDDDENREVTAEVLGGGGYAVALAATARDGMAAFDDGCDVVLVDLSLPDHDGWTVARHVKQRSPGTPVVLVTGWSGAVSLDGARRCGVDEVI